MWIVTVSVSWIIFQIFLLYIENQDLGRSRPARYGSGSANWLRQVLIVIPCAQHEKYILKPNWVAQAGSRNILEFVKQVPVPEKFFFSKKVTYYEWVAKNAQSGWNKILCPGQIRNAQDPPPLCVVLTPLSSANNEQFSWCLLYFLQKSQRRLNLPVPAWAQI
jgi:hypothetical protein